MCRERERWEQRLRTQAGDSRVESASVASAAGEPVREASHAPSVASSATGASVATGSHRRTHGNAAKGQRGGAAAAAAAQAEQLPSLQVRDSIPWKNAKALIRHVLLADALCCDAACATAMRIAQSSDVCQSVAGACFSSTAAVRDNLRNAAGAQWRGAR